MVWLTNNLSLPFDFSISFQSNGFKSDEFAGQIEKSHFVLISSFIWSIMNLRNLAKENAV
jgi:hypothetical protein